MEGGREKMKQKTNEIGSSMDSEIRRGSFQEDGGSGLGGGTGDSQTLGGPRAMWVPRKEVKWRGVGC